MPAKTIPLTQGYLAMVDEADFWLVKDHKWYAGVSRSKNYTRVYAQREVGGRTVQMHKFLMGCVEFVDHRDGNTLNNQRFNLRKASGSQNATNRRRSVCQSRFRGVYWRKNRTRWTVQIRKDGKLHGIGLYRDEMDAATAYNFAVTDFHGEFAQFNLPVPPPPTVITTVKETRVEPVPPDKKETP
jgi:myo-inositol-hexaphosphate 3-phosphohydrolase